jgi:hypothetical protein
MFFIFVVDTQAIFPKHDCALPGMGAWTFVLQLRCDVLDDPKIPA